MKRFNELPQELQERIKGHLQAFDEVRVTFEYGKYHFGSCLKATYGADHEYIGTYRAEDIYTEKERIENYINQFHDYPIQYKGKRDYAILNKMDDEREVNAQDNTVTDWVGEINEQGNFELTKKITYKI